MNAIQQFQDAIRSAGLTPPDMIETDGRLRRFASNGKRGDDAGWFCCMATVFLRGALATGAPGLPKHGGRTLAAP